ncbi:MAG: LacI family transcriptional regulator [Ruminococcus sp.]|nr:LacI family transcriptional regulator [Ruminococcus sp.]
MERRKEVRLEHIASEVGVSIVTVSNALKGKKGVSEELRSRICETAARLGYQTESAAKKKKESYIIGIAVAERYVKEFPSFYMDVYKRAAQELTKRGSMSVLEVVNEGQEKMLHGFSAFQGVDVAGIILIGEMHKDYIAEFRKNCSVPLVCVDCYDVFEGIEYVVTDSYGGMEQMTELLLEAGHRNLMFVGTPGATGSITDRFLGYCKALEKRGIEVKETNVLHDRKKDGYDYKIDMELPEELPDGFVCNCDKSACILIEKLRERGIRVPEDVSVVGFDHYYSQVQTGLELSTYENDEKVIAHISVKTLLKRLEGRKKPAGVRIVEGKIIQGNTVGDPCSRTRTEA